LRKEEKQLRKRELRQQRGDARRVTLRRRTFSRVRYGVNGVKGRLRRCWKRIAKYWKAKTSSGTYTYVQVRTRTHMCFSFFLILEQNERQGFYFTKR